MSIKEVEERVHTLLDLNKCLDENYLRTPVDKNLVIFINEQQDGKCWICGCKTTLPLTHHIKPDGESIRENLVMLCPLCHQWIHWILKKELGYRGSAVRTW